MRRRNVRSGLVDAWPAMNGSWMTPGCLAAGLSTARKHFSLKKEARIFV
jgi:hypothetical protein